jgi:hypothetical protein
LCVARCLDYPGVLAWIQQRRLNRKHFWVVRKIYQVGWIIQLS